MITVMRCLSIPKAVRSHLSLSMDISHAEFVIKSLDKTLGQIDKITQSCGGKFDKLSELKKSELLFLRDKEKELRKDLEHEMTPQKTECNKLHVNRDFDGFKTEHPYIAWVFEWLLALAITVTGYKYGD